MKRPSFRKIFIVLGVVVMLAAIPVATILYQKYQTYRSGAAVFGGYDIICKDTPGSPVVKVTAVTENYELATGKYEITWTISNPTQQTQTVHAEFVACRCSEPNAYARPDELAADPQFSHTARLCVGNFPDPGDQTPNPLTAEYARNRWQHCAYGYQTTKENLGTTEEARKSKDDRARATSQMYDGVTGGGPIVLAPSGESGSSKTFTWPMDSEKMINKFCGSYQFTWHIFKVDGCEIQESSPTVVTDTMGIAITGSGKDLGDEDYSIWRPSGLTATQIGETCVAATVNASTKCDNGRCVADPVGTATPCEVSRNDPVSGQNVNCQAVLLSHCVGKVCKLGPGTKACTSNTNCETPTPYCGAMDVGSDNSGIPGGIIRYYWDRDSCEMLVGGCEGNDCDYLFDQNEENECKAAFAHCTAPPIQSHCVGKSCVSGAGKAGSSNSCTAATATEKCGNYCEAMDVSSPSPTCQAVIGYYWNKTACVALSGCSAANCQGTDCGRLFTTEVACKAAFTHCTATTGTKCQNRSCVADPTTTSKPCNLALNNSSTGVNPACSGGTPEFKACDGMQCVVNPKMTAPGCNSAADCIVKVCTRANTCQEVAKSTLNLSAGDVVCTSPSDCNVKTICNGESCIVKRGALATGEKTCDRAKNDNRSYNPDCQETYKRCVGAQCVVEIGDKPDQCDGNDDCTPDQPQQPGTHQECNDSKRCVSVTGTGSDECTDDIHCQEPTHKDCVGPTCTVVDGAGRNTCSNNDDCATPTHMECLSNNTCGVVQGSARNECINNLDCQQIKHLVCWDYACRYIHGAGMNECLVDEDCAKPKHLACTVNKTCRETAGSGYDQCTTDADCATPVTHQECKDASCIQVAGPLPTQAQICLTDADCAATPPEATYKACLSNACVTLRGTPPQDTQLCETDSDCTVTPPIVPDTGTKHVAFAIAVVMSLLIAFSLKQALRL